MTVSAYPVQVTGHLDREVSRWQWLLKWALAIPHWVVLAVLWLAFAVLSVVAWVGILVTGRYPRAVFEFNVGVLRWTWRVTYYTYGALATDRYPPFSLDRRPDYPASFDVDYPEHLSRGLALVKTWLLALPHYLVVGLFVGGSWYALDQGAGVPRGPAWTGGLIGILALVAGVVLLVTGRYPQSVFDLLLGLNRWVLRVAAYAGLMTDVYPPFRLDLGGDEPAVETVTQAAGAPGSAAPMSARTVSAAPMTAAPTPAAPTAPAPTTAPADPTTPAPTAATARPTGTIGGWRALGITIAAVVAALSLGATGAGVALAAVDVTSRDDAGFVTSPAATVTSDGYALVSERIDLDRSWLADAVSDDVTGTVRVTARGETPVFLGVARADDVDAYLAGVRRHVVAGLGESSTGTAVSGTAAPAAPTDRDIWSTSASGAGTQTVTWDLDPGRWTVVVMNADGSRGVQAEVSVGAELPVLGRLAAGLAVAGVVGLVLCGAALVMLFRSRPASG
ncbi:MAG: DUF4389 domain-containing protein [Dermatophilaceae bacterium]